jgi:capsular exopolysaccharide synthesis family protein
MAKVYDALRRAEAERKRKASGSDLAPSVARLDWEPEAPVPEPARPAPPPAKSDSLGQRLRLRLRGRVDVANEVNKRRISLLQPDSYVAEQFRALRGRIDALANRKNLRTIAVTSAMPGEGKTTAAVNLAIVTALSLGKRVLLVDCDLRRPKVHQSLALQPDQGLAEVLRGDADLDEAILRVDGIDLDVLAVRGRPANPSELLGAKAMRDLVEVLSQRYDRVILDTPAALGLPDAKVVSDLCDGIVMVVRADTTRNEDIQMVLEIMDRERVLGLLLNGAVIKQGRYGYVA